MLVKGVTKIFSDCADCIIQTQKTGKRFVWKKFFEKGLRTFSKIRLLQDADIRNGDITKIGRVESTASVFSRGVWNLHVVNR